MNFISCFELGMYMLRDFVSANCFAGASARMVHVWIQMFLLLQSFGIRSSNVPKKRGGEEERY